MNEHEVYSGGCVCSAIRYKVHGPPAMVAYCHCDDCRKSSGSVVSVLAGFQRDGFELINGNPTYFEATPVVKRSFCKTCGAPLFYENQNFPENIYIHIGSFDDPDQLPPDRHTWVSERITWHEIKDSLRQYDQLSNNGLAGNTPSYEKPAA
jgi:hypothetical protein